MRKDCKHRRHASLALLSQFFGGLAVLLTAIGLYGVISYSVAKRAKQIDSAWHWGRSARRCCSLYFAKWFSLPWEVS